ncbi:hypothetical protein EG68_09241 [Paragonimus skrjabini miyazakii]|uniref:Uncharacterized protein n=1 Tax=Paragonimus skrjabini miyazakii TaxID=59628 RepID=A0A8S9YWP9_9TREM|nr:hypothetical protein EG68_09241 [Paragonimus skrjabini miyazakii]
MKQSENPDTALSICTHRLWTKITSGQLDCLLSAKCTENITSILIEAGFSKEPDLFAELTTTHCVCSRTVRTVGVLFRFRTLAFSSLNTVCPFATIVEAMQLAHKLLLCHSVQRPPNLIQIFSIRLAQISMQFIVNRFFRYWKLYKHALAPTVNLIPTFTYGDKERKADPVESPPSGKRILRTILKSAVQDQFGFLNEN